MVAHNMTTSKFGMDAGKRTFSSLRGSAVFGFQIGFLTTWYPELRPIRDSVAKNQRENNMGVQRMLETCWNNLFYC